MKHILLLLALAIPSVGSAQIFNRIVSGESFTVNLNEQRTDKSFVVRLRIPDTPIAIRNAELFDDRGREIQFRMLADPVNGIIIGTPVEGLQVELINLVDGEDNPRFIVTGRRGEETVNLNADDLYITDLKFGEYCVSLTSLEASNLPINVNLAVDISGSMFDALPDVRQSFLDFMGQLPDKAMCRVTLFDDVSRYIHPNAPGGGILSTDSAPTFQCAEFEKIDVETIFQARGGTNIVGALAPLYQHALEQPDALNLVSVISDGLGSASRSSQAFVDLVVLRSQAVEEVGAYTLVNWLGGYQSNYPLGDLADSSIFGRVGNQPFAQEFFAQNGQFLGAQSVLQPVACNGSEN